MTDRREFLTGCFVAIILVVSGCAAAERCINRGEGVRAEGTVAVICAKMPWNRTGIRLEKGRYYRFAAGGSWRDGAISANVSGFIDSAAGERLKRFAWMRRVREAPWFSLVGTMGKTLRTPFDIGGLIATGSVFQAPETGELYCFANDAHFRYFNNTGAIELTVIAVAGPYAE